MEDWGFHHFGDVGAVHGGAGVAGVGCGEADLVVDDEVDGAARAVAAGARHVEIGLVHAQADKGGITVDEHGQNLFLAFFAAPLLFGARGTADNGIDDFQMGGVEGEGNVHCAVGGADVGTESVVVFHVAAGVFDVHAPFKFGKQVGGLLAQCVHQHVQPAPVRHADDDFFHAVFSCVLNQIVQGGNRAFAAFHGEAFLPDIFGVQITFQRFGGGELFQDEAFLLGGKLRGGQIAFKTVAYPQAFFKAADVHVFHADVPAVCFLQFGDDVGKRQPFCPAHGKIASQPEFQRHIGIGKPVFGRRKPLHGARVFQFQRVQIGGIRTLYAVCGNQAQHGNLFFQQCFGKAA